MRKARNKYVAVALALVVALALPATAEPLIHGYSEGMALAEDNGRWGYADVSGRVVIPVQYDSAQSFRLGTAKVERNGKLGLIRADGKTLIKTEYDTLSSVGYGLYIAQEGAYWGVVSIVPMPTAQGGGTQELYPLIYDSVTLTQASGLSVLSFSQAGIQTIVPLTDLPSLLAARGAPSTQFPLIQDRLPSFSDVGPRDWFAVWVDLAYNVGLMEGKGDGRFDPSGTLTVAEAVKLAAYMESRHTGDDFHLQSATGSPWYRPALTYCVASGICREEDFDSYERPITRGEMARLFAATSLGRSMPVCNDLTRVKASIPDVAADSPAAEAVWSLYAKGIFTGTDGNLTFRPDDNLTRAEAAAIAARMARAEQRVTLWSAVGRSVPLPEESTPNPTISPDI